MFWAKFLEYLSRKFILSVLSLSGSFALAWYGKDLMGWVAAITPILAFYIGTNTYQDYLATKKGGVAPPPKED